MIAVEPEAPDGGVASDGAPAVVDGRPERCRRTAEDRRGAGTPRGRVRRVYVEDLSSPGPNRAHYDDLAPRTPPPAGSRMTLDDLWFLADEATQRAEQAYHRLRNRYGDHIELSTTHRVSRSHFRRLARRVKETGTPYGVQTIVRDGDRLLLVRHDDVDLWVLPGGEVAGDETYRETAERELAEEAGVTADYEGLGIANRIDIECREHSTWGVLPVFAARATATETSVNDPDGEISDASWFPVDDLPPDTRDRSHLLQWWNRRERT